MDTPFWPTSSDDSLPDNPILTPQQLPRLVAQNISPALVNYLVQRVCDAVDSGLGRSSPSTSSSRTNHSRRWHSEHDLDNSRSVFAEFVAAVLRRAEVTLSGLLGALVYIDRARPHLSIAIEEWAHHRVLLGALILASKYLNDSSLKNAHWALCTGIFGRLDVARIEREFLEVLDFELSVKEHDIVRECTRMVSEGVLALPEDAQARPKKETSLHAVRAIWEEKARLESSRRTRPEKRHADVVDMDTDMDMNDDVREQHTRRRKERRSVEVYLPSTQMAVPSPTSSQEDSDSVSPMSSCSTCLSSSSPDFVSVWSPETDSDASPCTPPPAPVGAFHYPFPHPGAAVPAKHHQHHHHSSTGIAYKPLQLLEHFPAVPTPPLVLTPSRKAVAATAPLLPPPACPPYPALPLNFTFPASGPALRDASPYSHMSTSVMALYPLYLPVPALAS